MCNRLVMFIVEILKLLLIVPIGLWVLNLFSVSVLHYTCIGICLATFLISTKNFADPNFIFTFVTDHDHKSIEKLIVSESSRTGVLLNKVKLHKTKDPN